MIDYSLQRKHLEIWSDWRVTDDIMAMFGIRNRERDALCRLVNLRGNRWHEIYLMKKVEMRFVRGNK